ncbi:MAG: methyltransferase domain-containing protein [Gemmatimonadetes bacterium]|nr:methyltransferase domain-containing protein [Gemmatimonadota bacterium]
MLNDATLVYVPEYLEREQDGLHVLLDPAAPNWIATDARGARIARYYRGGRRLREAAQLHAQHTGLDTGRAWVEVYGFTRDLLRRHFAAPEPAPPAAYAGRQHVLIPRLRELWLHTNNSCNLACRHCLVRSGPGQDPGLSGETWFRVIDQAVELGVRRFYITGGEPLLRRDFWNMVERITEVHGQGLVVLTNAMLLTGRHLDQLRRFSPERLRLQISLDGSTPEVNDAIRGRGCYERTLRGIRSALASGFAPAVTTVIGPENEADVPGVTRLIASLGVANHHLLWTHRRGRAADNGMVLSTERVLAVVREVARVAEEVGIEVDNLASWRLRLDAPPGTRYDLSNAGYESLCIAYDGVAYPSAATAGERGLSCGSIEESSLAQIWEHSPVLAMLRGLTAEEKEKCRSCYLKGQCGGGDLEHSYYYTLSRPPDPAAYPPPRPRTNGGDGAARAESLPDAGADAHAHAGNVGVATAAAPLVALETRARARLGLVRRGNGAGGNGAGALERARRAFLGLDPYCELHQGVWWDEAFRLAREGRAALNTRSAFPGPAVFRGMGEKAGACAEPAQADAGELPVRTQHSTCVLSFDLDRARQAVRRFYSQAAQQPQAELCCPTAYPAGDTAHIPVEVLERFYGCGSPVALAGVQPGETYLDLGAGGGIDCFIAARKVGPAGQVIGVDMTDAMLDVARRNAPLVAERLGYDVVSFRKGYLEEIPVEEGLVDVLTSNCVINLSPDKKRVFAEMWRVLKDRGRIVVSDIIAGEEVPPAMRADDRLWGECISGALTADEFLGLLEQAGFYGLEVLSNQFWKQVHGYRFSSITVRGYRYAKQAGCVYIGQQAIYRGPFQAVLDEEGHLFPRNQPVEVCTDTAAKLEAPPYAGLFTVTDPTRPESEAFAACCTPGGACC